MVSHARASVFQEYVFRLFRSASLQGGRYREKVKGVSEPSPFSA